MGILENSLKGILDIAQIKKKYTVIEENIKIPFNQSQPIKEDREPKIKKLSEMRTLIENEDIRIEKASEPLHKAIHQLGVWRTKWREEIRQWEAWQFKLIEDEELYQLNSIFSKATDKIESALQIINAQLDSMLKLQEKAGNIQARIIAINTERDYIIAASRSGVMETLSPPIFSSAYLSQYSPELWYSLKGVFIQIAVALSLTCCIPICIYAFASRNLRIFTS